MSTQSPAPAHTTDSFTTYLNKLDEDPQQTLSTKSEPRTIDECTFSLDPAFPETPVEAHTQPATGEVTPDQLEASTPVRQHVTGIVPSFSYPAKNRWRVLCACITYFGNGMHDGAPGALIPYLEKHYDIGYATVALIFVTTAIGFVLTATVTDAVHSRLGRARTLMLSEVIMIAGYVMIVCTPPFAGVVVAFLLIGLGYAFNLALNNVFTATLQNPTVIVGAAHGAFGFGALTAPLIATAMVSRGILWSRFFLIILGIRCFVFFFTGWANKGYEDEAATRLNTQLERMASQQATTSELTKLQLLKKVLSNRTTLFGALFIFAYQGSEISNSGWITSYLISARNGNPAEVGYVTSGFWGGITLGRFTLVHLARRTGEKPLVVALVAGSIALQILVWLVPNIIGEAIAVSLLGLLLGPVYPCATTVFSRALPSRLQVSSLGFISSGGSSGGAVFPFLTGLLAQVAGTYVLHPICIALFVMMIGCWLMLPAERKRDD